MSAGVCKPEQPLGCSNSMQRTFPCVQLHKTHRHAQLRQPSTLSHPGHNHGASRDADFVLGDICSRDGEGGDTQMKGGDKEEDFKRVFSSSTPTLLDKINCEVQVRCRSWSGPSVGGLLWAGRPLALSRGFLLMA